MRLGVDEWPRWGNARVLTWHKRSRPAQLPAIQIDYKHFQFSKDEFVGIAALISTTKGAIVQIRLSPAS